MVNKQTTINQRMDLERHGQVAMAMARGQKE
jgi:hypothetical protein